MTKPSIYHHGQWYMEQVPFAEIAEKFGTPCYAYSKAAIEAAYQAFAAPLQGYPHCIHYAVKANSNLAILNILATQGAGFDIVSQGELERVLKAGGDPAKVIFSGVGKTKEEILRAIDVNVGCINVESESELLLLNEIAKLKNKQISMTLRVNPNIDPKSHPYISTGLKETKFGIPVEQALPLTKELGQNSKRFQQLKLKGLACHIGSQITQLDPFLAALDRMLELVQELAHSRIDLETLNMGGGLGIPYHNDTTLPSTKIYVEALLNKLKHHSKNKKPLTLYLEPGRAITAGSGILLTKVHHIKETKDKNFAIVDGGMNDLLRPALYHAYQEIQTALPNPSLKQALYDVVGPVCETSDFLGKDRLLALEQGTLLAVFNAGAYGFSMSSNYNTRPRPPEILVDGNQCHLVRPRETYAELFNTEKIVPDQN